jgi:hypothetical protein
MHDDKMSVVTIGSSLPYILQLLALWVPGEGSTPGAGEGLVFAP